MVPVASTSYAAQLRRTENTTTEQATPKHQKSQFERLKTMSENEKLALACVTTNKGIEDALMGDNHVDVRIDLAMCTRNKAVLSKLKDGESVEVRISVASNPFTDPKDLKVLAEDERSEVRILSRAVGLHQQTRLGP